MLFLFKNVTYSIGFEQKHQISLSNSVSKGKVLVIRGPSGSGKSTLLRILARLQTCLSGEVFLKGESWSKIPGTQWRASVHYLHQKPALFEGTIADNLAKPFETRILSKNMFDIHHAKSIMEQLLLSPTLWEQDARTLSGGEAARIAFTRALLINPTILLLDEPTAALDETSRKAMYVVLSKWLQDSERAVLLVSHNNDYEEILQPTYLDIIPL